ncbi:MAG: hypothetical protein LC770_10160 [Acidobacteria bacterium]|nr:hypothetical protein [Acidobacteriota bacterium]
METPAPHASVEVSDEDAASAVRLRFWRGGQAARARVLWSSFAGNPSIRAAVFTFTFSRVIVLTILIVGGQINLATSGGVEEPRQVDLSLWKISIARIVQRTVMTADVNWYAGIATEGYHKTGFKTDKHYNWGFFPFFPVLWRLVWNVTSELPLTGMLLSHVFFLAALFFVHRSALAFGYEERIANRALFYLAFFPTSYFYSLPLPESLFLLLTAASLNSAGRGRWLAAGLCGALASATRFTGVLLLPALVALYWQTHGWNWRRREVLSLCLIPVGLLSFMAYLQAITGNAFAFKDVMVVWGRSTSIFLVPLLDFLRDPLLLTKQWDFRVVNFTAAVLALSCGVVLLRKRRWAFGVYTLGSILVTLSSVMLQSQARYAMVLFPMYIVLAAAGEPRRVDEVIRTVSVALLSLMTALFAAYFSFALS